MTSLRCYFPALAILASLATPVLAADPFEFKDGDRVVLLGSTLIEREQKYGYWELLLTLHNADKNVTFRNLGWSGDTVFGEARNGFDSSPKGFERLVTLTKELKPTVIVVCYGHNESFEGQKGISTFAAGLNKLLDSLAATKARIVLVSPTPFEKAGPVTDPTARDKSLDLYRQVLAETAAKRQLPFVDLFDRIRGASNASHLTYNGLHMTPAGYAATAPLLLAESSTGAQRDKWLAELESPAAEKVRAKIVEKNQLFFYRWRPQNETYLFGFRKHEQGQNAKEVAQFDPLVDGVEKEIAELKKAVRVEAAPAK
ncbi:SGNH/GDSL hydrolase family protein [Fimbriiglobus ruber]|uniref:Aquaporin Z n=1 Tax=Fimbriiglobus ruber TaxID=1908690 RepID=A0A225DCM3_9BACT|nr:SGNH/GDSL hydrolase family protein [Fimbriiglobus ruber]OWK34879.1 Aquaporin Z [Fimbriiglobus ruber]